MCSDWGWCFSHCPLWLSKDFRNHKAFSISSCSFSAPVCSQCTAFEQWCLRFLEKEFLAFLDRHDLCCIFYSFIYSSTHWHFSSLTYVKEKNQVTSFETHFYIGNINASVHTHSSAACALPECPPEPMCSSWLTHRRPGPNERLNVSGRRPRRVTLVDKGSRNDYFDS